MPLPQAIPSSNATNARRTARAQTRNPLRVRCISNTGTIARVRSRDDNLSQRRGERFLQPLAEQPKRSCETLRDMNRGGIIGAPWRWGQGSRRAKRPAQVSRGNALQGGSPGRCSPPAPRTRARAETDAIGFGSRGHCQHRRARCRRRAGLRRYNEHAGRFAECEHFPATAKLEENSAMPIKPIVTFTAVALMVANLAVLRSATEPQRIEAAEPAAQEPTVAQLKAEIEQLRGWLPDQSHVMQDVSYHYANLWFAGQKQNWPLAEFYLSETKSHLQWAVRVKPKGKDLANRDIDLVAILQAIETTPLKQLTEAVAARQSEPFEKAYRSTLSDGCYTCHKAADKPYLRPQVPTAPETPIINFDPQGEVAALAIQSALGPEHQDRPARWQCGKGLATGRNQGFRSSSVVALRGGALTWRRPGESAWPFSSGRCPADLADSAGMALAGGAAGGLEPPGASATPGTPPGSVRSERSLRRGAVGEDRARRAAVACCRLSCPLRPAAERSSGEWPSAAEEVSGPVESTESTSMYAAQKNG